MRKWLVLYVCLWVNTALAGDAHFHPKKVAKCKKVTCNKEEIKLAVSEGIRELQKWGKIDKKWLDAKVVTVELKTFKKKQKSITVWVVDISKQIKDGWDLQYVYFTQKGKVFRANNTGELK